MSNNVKPLEIASNEIVLFESADSEVTLPVEFDGETVWLTQAQIAQLFNKDRSVITRHINNAINEGEVTRESNVQKMHIANSDKPVSYYDLDVIISVGYRVKSQRGVEFRRWATQVLRRHIVEGHTENERRLAQLGQVARVMKRLEGSLEADQILSVVESYSRALE